MSRADEVVITGVGVVSPIGIGNDTFWQNLCAGVSGVRRLTQFEPRGLPVHIGAEILDFQPQEYIQPRKSLKVMSRDIQLGVTVAQLACQQAGLQPGTANPERFGVVFGADLLQDALEALDPVYRSCLDGERFDFDRWGQAMTNLFPLFMLKYLPNMTACHIAIARDARGPNNTVTMGAVSSLLAILEASRVIDRGWADVMIAGGSGTRVYPLKFVQSCLGEPLSRQNETPGQAVKPFDAHRDGYANGEGAAAFVLERRSHAEARQAPILARILGCGRGCEPSKPHQLLQGTGLRAAMQGALREAKFAPGDVGHVNANGWGTLHADQTEAKLIRELLGEVPVVALKGYLGYAGAGSGALELAATVLGMGHGQIPPTLNFSTPDPACPVNVVHGQPLTGPGVNSALILNQSMVGQAAALVLAKEE